MSVTFHKLMTKIFNWFIIFNVFNVHGSVHRNNILIYRVSIKSFPEYKHLLQEKYVEYKHIFFLNVMQMT